ncbi:MAG: guanylate kinase [Eubacteriales bacterium]|nr:guanylate kinase [Eubacteriales bacterium]MDD4389292.1 guanylate kinase [Eubacteriales bacterium]
MEKGRLFVVSGPSGVGKGAICHRLIKDRDLRFSVSMTTRKPREGEKHGEDYYFISHEEFQEIRNANGFLEHAEVYGNFYGTPCLEIQKTLSSGKDVLLDIDTQGALNVKKFCSEAIFIFILPPSKEELKRRIKARGTETEESLKTRLSAAINEISFLGNYDYCVVNDDLDIAAAQAGAIIEAERVRVSDDAEEVNAIIEKYKEGM